MTNYISSKLKTQNSKLFVNNVEINVEIRGSGPSLVLMHGFTGSAISWREHSAKFAENFQVMALDALGHGLSDAPADAARYSFKNLTADFVTVLDKLEIEKTALLGYSMGGRMALNIALNAPERISRLILESASPGLQDIGERKAREISDNALAHRIERWGIEAFVDYWQDLPLWESQRNLPKSILQRQRAARLKNNPCGLANSLRGVGTGVQPSLWERLPELKMPVLLIAGELDTKFVAIARQMQAKIAQARLEIVPGAGHTVHLEQPELFDRLTLEMLKSE